MFGKEANRKRFQFKFNLLPQSFLKHESETISSKCTQTKKTKQCSKLNQDLIPGLN